MKTYYIYILKCNDNTYYVGFTNNLERRLVEHKTGINKSAYTHDKRPIHLVWFETFNNVHDAIACEKKIKGWSRRKKEAMIAEDWEKLVLYSKNYTEYGTHSTNEGSPNNGSSTS
jgi:putative endonuclease